MTDHYEDDEETKAKRVLSNSAVLRFIASFWMRRPWLFWPAVGLMLVAIGFDLALPWAAKRLVDAVSAIPREPPEAWTAWAWFVGVYLAFSLIRNVDFRFRNPMAAASMMEMTDEGFKRVQSF
jgi:ATP-binding cassette subfamily B protein